MARRLPSKAVGAALDTLLQGGVDNPEQLESLLASRDLLLKEPGEPISSRLLQASSSAAARTAHRQCRYRSLRQRDPAKAAPPPLSEDAEIEAAPNSGREATARARDGRLHGKG